MSPCLRGEKTRRAFTLVELLVVIMIIAILAGLITAAAIPALRAAHRTVIIGEISQLGMALERYKQEHDDYPPDFAGLQGSDPTATQQAVLRHLRKAFPRYRPAGTTVPDQWNSFRLHVKQCSSGDAGLTDPDATQGMDVNDMTPAMALVFWLGGPTAPSGSSTRLLGFSANPANPFAIGGSRLDSFFTFNEDRLARREDSTNPDRYGYEYQPPHVQDPDGGPDAPPYVYFQARADGYIRQSSVGKGDRENTTVNDPPFLPYYAQAGVGACMPYAKSSQPDPNNSDILIYKWFNPATFQIICCGFDGIYGPVSSTVPPAGVAKSMVRYVDESQGTLEPEEDDNLTNFSKGALGDWNEGK